MFAEQQLGKNTKTQQTTDRRKSANSTNSLLIFVLTFYSAEPFQQWSMRIKKKLSAFFFILKEIRFGKGEETNETN